MRTESHTNGLCPDVRAFRGDQHMAVNVLDSRASESAVAIARTEPVVFQAEAFTYASQGRPEVRKYSVVEIKQILSVSNWRNQDMLLGARIRKLVSRDTPVFRAPE